MEFFFRFFFFSSRRRHTRLQGDWSSDVCSSDLDRLVTTRILLLRPSTAPLEISPLARNQFSISGSWARSMRATFFIGSRRLRMARKHRRLVSDGSVPFFFSMYSNNRVCTPSSRRRRFATFKDSYCAVSRLRAAAEIWPDSSKRWYGVFGSSYLRWILPPTRNFSLRFMVGWKKFLCNVRFAYSSRRISNSPVVSMRRYPTTFRTCVQFRCSTQALSFFW